jgi:hypothetical protein
MKKLSFTFKFITILTSGFFLLASTGYTENEIPEFSKELKRVLDMYLLSTPVLIKPSVL